MKNRPSLFLIPALLAMCVASGPACASETADAISAYQEGDFTKAARDFETALSAGEPSAGNYFNLGLAYRKAGEPALAAMNFRRAIMLDPQMMDARMALSDVERAQGIPLPPVDWKGWMAERVDLAVALVVGFTLFWVGAFWFLALAARARAGFFSMAAATLLCIAGTSAFVAAYLSDPRFIWRSASVAIDPGALLSAPADRSGKVAPVPAGAVVEVLRKSGDWSYCRLPDGTEGWLPDTTTLQPLLPDKG
jgi:tetratricopeptide (TPR) repeat protein